jgi:hypothetical protein
VFMFVCNKFMYPFFCPDNHENNFINSIFVMNINNYNYVIHDFDPNLFLVTVF